MASWARNALSAAAENCGGASSRPPSVWLGSGLGLGLGLGLGFGFGFGFGAGVGFGLGSGLRLVRGGLRVRGSYS